MRDASRDSYHPFALRFRPQAAHFHFHDNRLSPMCYHLKFENYTSRPLSAGDEPCFQALGTPHILPFAVKAKNANFNVVLGGSATSSPRVTDGWYPLQTTPSTQRTSQMPTSVVPAPYPLATTITSSSAPLHGLHPQTDEVLSPVPDVRYTLQTTYMA
jgi:hypothetical protein